MIIIYCCNIKIFKILHQEIKAIIEKKDLKKILMKIKDKVLKL